ncbi:MAG: hypothetical protein NDI69_09240 [Bacteriovoracaceae bacterium]|nr:hypothetical protein [Bacteriovoracaceae bacterium]
MKSFLFVSFLFCFLNTAFAQLTEPRAIIHSIDDYDFPYNYVEVSEEALPSDLNQQLLKQMDFLRFTPVTETRARALFERLKRDPRARMRSPGGFCTRRRIHIQNVLRGMNIVSGKLYINCPANTGRLRFRDQVSGRFYTFSNFHDTNVVLVKTASGNSYRILDLQFQSRPVSLNNYLAQLEAFQRIQPAIRNAIKAGTCFWRVSSPNRIFKEQL